MMRIAANEIVDFVQFLREGFSVGTIPIAPEPEPGFPEPFNLRPLPEIASPRRLERSAHLVKFVSAIRTDGGTFAGSNFE
jgi:hypothetical protein